MNHSAPVLQAPPRPISMGAVTGRYQAFPDLCRLQNGDLLSLFYSGSGHVTMPSEEWPQGGRICAVRSSDGGESWSEPWIAYEDADDNRDSHIAQLSDGTLLCSFFSLRSNPKGKQRFGESSYDLVGVQLIRSHDNGRTWSKPQLLAPEWACSAPVRELSNGTLIMGIYWPGGDPAWGGVLRSEDSGKTWSKPIPIGLEAKLPLNAETDVIELENKVLLAILRGDGVNMHASTSSDHGRTWTPVHDLGFFGHCPHLLRLQDGRILMSYRARASDFPELAERAQAAETATGWDQFLKQYVTAMRLSSDEGQTWSTPYLLDDVAGAYPSTAELSDGNLLSVYYSEGENSAIVARHLNIDQLN